MPRENSKFLSAGELVKRLKKQTGAGESTCWRAIQSEGYLGALLVRVGGGKFKLKEAED